MLYHIQVLQMNDKTVYFPNYRPLHQPFSILFFFILSMWGGLELTVCADDKLETKYFRVEYIKYCLLVKVTPYCYSLFSSCVNILCLVDTKAIL